MPTGLTQPRLVHLLVPPFGKDVLLACTAQIDAGFDTKVLADMIATLDRFTDDEIPVPGGLSVSESRAFHAAWRSDLMMDGSDCVADQRIVATGFAGR